MALMAGRLRAEETARADWLRGREEEKLGVRERVEAGMEGDLNVARGWTDWVRRCSTDFSDDEVLTDRESGFEVEVRAVFARSRMASMVKTSGEALEAGHEATGTGERERLAGGEDADDCLRTEEGLAHSPTKSSESLSCMAYGSSDSSSAPMYPWM
jgi:hypothetical protein